MVEWTTSTKMLLRKMTMNLLSLPQIYFVLCLAASTATHLTSWNDSEAKEEDLLQNWNVSTLESLLDLMNNTETSFSSGESATKSNFLILAASWPADLDRKIKDQSDILANNSAKLLLVTYSEESGRCYHYTNTTAMAAATNVCKISLVKGEILCCLSSSSKYEYIWKQNNSVMEIKSTTQPSMAYNNYSNNDRNNVILLLLENKQKTLVDYQISNVDGMHNLNKSDTNKQISLTQNDVQTAPRLTINEIILDYPTTQSPVNSTTTSLRKCCPDTFLFDMSKRNCTPVEDFPEWTPNTFKEHSLSPSEEDQNLSFVYGFPLCKYFFQLKTDEKDAENVYLLENGQMYMGKYNETYTSDNYCMDYFKYGNMVKEEALICFPAINNTTEDTCQKAHKIFIPICMSLSAIFLTLTFLVYATLPDLYSKINGKCVMSNACSLTMTFICYIIMERGVKLLTITACQLLGK